jgi:membrane protease YdiL (CAAX protease family)
MIGILIELLISLVLLRLSEKENLTAIGIGLSSPRLKYLGVGLLFPILYYSILFIVLSYVGKNPYRLNNNYTPANFLEAIGYVFKSVAFETLIFQGALLYILIKHFGSSKAILISAVSFGIYHWFSWNLFGQLSAMIITFLTTGIMGYVWAFAFDKTKSIYLPFALHFGYNFASMVLFSKDKNIGQQLFIQTFTADPYSPGTMISILLLTCYYIGFPILLFLYLRRIHRTTEFDKKVTTAN